MHFLSALMLGLATNLDNLMIGLMVGIQGRRVPIRFNALIALSSALAGYGCCALSALLCGMGRLPNLLGGALLMLLGLGTLRGARRTDECPPAPEADITSRQALMLSGSLALNCLAPALASGLTGIPPLAAGGMIGLFSFFAIGLGGWLGRRTQAHLGCRTLNILSALVMTALGVLEMLV